KYSRCRYNAPALSTGVRSTTMPVHDWTRVADEIFHDFHIACVAALQQSLNNGLLPSEFYSLIEQHNGLPLSDILNWQTSQMATAASSETAPDAHVTEVRRRSLAIRRISDHRLVALVEILSPANKRCARYVNEFAAKIGSAVGMGVHL